MTEAATVVVLHAIQCEVITERTAGLTPTLLPSSRSWYGPLQKPGTTQKCAGKYSSFCFSFI